MPRKKSPFDPGASGFKGFASFSKSLGTGAAGFYPSNRQFGTSVHRTVIEKWNLESDWVKWRKGFEIYNRTAWTTLKVENANYDPGLEDSSTNKEYIDAAIEATLYKGTNYEIDNTFSGYEYPTMNADSNTYYVVNRVPEYKTLGTVQSVKNNPETYPTNYNNGEVCVTINPDATSGRLLLQMVGERIADGAYTDNNRTEATLKRILTSDSKPVIYRGKTLSKELEKLTNFQQKATTIKITIPVADVSITNNTGDFTPNQGINYRFEQKPGRLDILSNPELLNDKVIYIDRFFIDKSISSMGSVTFDDDDYFFEATIENTEASQSLVALDQGVNELPPSMLDLNDLPTIFTTANARYTITGSYVFQKSRYQSYFGSKYLTGDVVSDEVNDISYSIIPFIVEKADIVNNELVIESRPFVSELNLYTSLNNGTQLVFSDNSFCKTTTSTTKWTDLDTDVNPWMDEVFSTGLALRPSPVYSCSCPNFSHSILAMPQASSDDGQRKTNRQNRYPLPTVMSPDEFGIIGQDQASGRISSWETEQHRLSFKQCKHTIASMFNNDIRVKEPNKYPITQEAKFSSSLEEFNEKLVQEIINASNAFSLSYERSGISISEIVFAMSNGLNLDSTETAYIVLDSR